MYKSQRHADAKSEPTYKSAAGPTQPGEDWGASTNRSKALYKSCTYLVRINFSCVFCAAPQWYKALPWQSTTMRWCVPFKNPTAPQSATHGMHRPRPRLLNRSTVRRSTSLPWVYQASSLLPPVGVSAQLAPSTSCPSLEQRVAQRVVDVPPGRAVAVRLRLLDGRTGAGAATARVGPSAVEPTRVSHLLAVVQAVVIRVQPCVRIWVSHAVIHCSSAAAVRQACSVNDLRRRHIEIQLTSDATVAFRSRTCNAVAGLTRLPLIPVTAEVLASVLALLVSTVFPTVREALLALARVISPAVLITRRVH